jgi:GxxExxY protein
MDGTHGHGHHLVFGDLTDRILDVAHKVHSALGPGLLEKPYKTCMSMEFTRCGIAFECEKYLPVVYQNETIAMGYRVDFLIESKVVVEVKSVENILTVHEAQLLSYLKLNSARVGLLINFNVAHLRQGIRRRINGY